MLRLLSGIADVSLFIRLVSDPIILLPQLTKLYHYVVGELTIVIFVCSFSPVNMTCFLLTRFTVKRLLNFCWMTIHCIQISYIVVLMYTTFLPVTFCRALVSVTHTRIKSEPTQISNEKSVILGYTALSTKSSSSSSTSSVSVSAASESSSRGTCWMFSSMFGFSVT